MEERKYWSRQEIRSLIEVFRIRPILWNANDLDYRNRIKKYDTYKEIARIYSTTPFEIERKIKILVSQYHREKRSFEKLQRIKWFGYKAMTFLNDKHKLKEATTISKKKEPAGSSEQKIEKSQLNTRGSIEQQHATDSDSEASRLIIADVDTDQAFEGSTAAFKNLSIPDTILVLNEDENKIGGDLPEQQIVKSQWDIQELMEQYESESDSEESELTSTDDDADHLLQENIAAFKNFSTSYMVLTGNEDKNKTSDYSSEPKIEKNQLSTQGLIDQRHWSEHNPVESRLIISNVDSSHPFEGSFTKFGVPVRGTPESSSKIKIGNDGNNTCMSSQIFEMVKCLFDKNKREENLSPRRDEYDVFGETVAHNIRALKTEHLKVSVQHHINNLLYGARNGSWDFSQNSRFMTPVRSTSSNFMSDHSLTSVSDMGTAWNILQWSLETSQTNDTWMYNSPRQ